MKTAEFDFTLPDELIALRPSEERSASRLLVLQKTGSIEHRTFAEIGGYLSRGDLLLLNNTKVFPARLTGFKPTGGRLELLLVKEHAPGSWETLSRGRYTGPLRISPELSASVTDGSTVLFHSESGRDLDELLTECGEMPLPPYIKRQPDRHDKIRYQTVYAEHPGSIAAPTAGLHFTPELLEELSGKGVLVRYLTLHVGTGTFRMIKHEDLSGHQMDSETFVIPSGLLREIEDVKESGGRVFSVGTTTTRAIEGCLSGRCSLSGSSNGTVRGTTDIFMYPGYAPHAVDCLITNFHLPRSTPLMLASVFAGRENLLKSYEIAIRMKYRFFSYGDAMLVL